MKLQALLLTTFTLFPLTACLEADAPEDEETPDVAALCLAATTPGAPSQSETVTSSGSQTIVASNYGTSVCSRTTVELRQTRHVNVTVPSLTTRAACEGTRVYATVFYDEDGYGTFVRDEILAESGVWMGTYCREPGISYTVPETHIHLPNGGGSHSISVPRDVRIVVSAKRTTCSGIYCGTTYGLPVRAIGWQ